VQVQHTCSHTDSGNEQPEQTNASSDDQPSKLMLGQGILHQQSVRKPSRYLVDA